MKSLSGRRVVPCRQTDGRTDRQTARHNEANSGLSLVCETPKKLDDEKVQNEMSLNYQIVSEIKFRLCVLMRRKEGRKQIRMKMRR
jgi:hypothetical protein